MNTRLLWLIGVIVLVASVAANAQMIKRTDAIWARTTTSPITLDGKLDEPAWATAESLNIQYKVDARVWMPAYGWYAEGGLAQTSDPTDPTNATIKFLVKGDSLYVAFICRDKSIGGDHWGAFDALLMNLRSRRPTGYNPDIRSWNNFQSGEYFYGWVKEGWADTTMNQPGKLPGFFGWMGSDGNNAVTYSPRTDSMKAIWDAATVVHGVQNDDTNGDDTSWVTEVKFNLKERGYDVSQVGGETVMWSVDIFDADYNWPLDTNAATSKFSDTRTWVASPWGNAAWGGHLNILVRSDVTTSSGPVPTIPADYVIPSAGNYAAPTLDGKLDEPVWAKAPSFQIKYGDDAVRDTYAPGIRYRSGQQQQTVNGGMQSPLDPNLATVKYFFKDDALYLGFDVDDQCVQSFEGSRERWDGFCVSINIRDTLQGDHALDGRSLSFIVSPTGGVMLKDFNGNDSVRTSVALSLKPGTTVDTLGVDSDAGYTAEMKLDLTKWGYPAGRGDGVVLLGVRMYDGDTFTGLGNATGTFTWWAREAYGWDGNGGDGPAWMYMDPGTVLGVNDATAKLPLEFKLLGNYPNPFNPSTTIKFTVGRTSEVTLQVFDILGRQVAMKSLGVRQPGEHAVPFDASSLASGTYFYRLKTVNGNSTLQGKMMLLK